MLQKPPPVLVVDRFPALLDALLNLLTNLSQEEWQLPVHEGEWIVKDVAQHLLGDEINILSNKRDRFSEKYAPVGSWEELVALINHRNKVWVAATRRMSPRIICELLRLTGEQVNEYFRTVNLDAVGGPVNWAGPAPAPVWLDVAREFTERWHHQQHIRAAVGKPGCTEAYYLAPVLATFAHALPETFRAVDALDGTCVSLTVTGTAGGVWSTVREQGEWRLYMGKSEHPQAEIELPEETAWQLFTKGITKEEARENSRRMGDLDLAAKILDMVSIIA